MKTIYITHNGFHGIQTHGVKGHIMQVGDRFNVTVSKSGAKKFNCRMKDCRCGEGLSESFSVALSRVFDDCVEVIGNYPQAR